MEAKDYTFALAVYGAVLSTIALIATLRRERSKLSVRALIVRRHIEPGKVQRRATVRVVNRGYRPVSVTMPIFRVGSGGKRLLLDLDEEVSFPRRLQDGEAVQVSLSIRSLVTELQKRGHSQEVELVPECKTASGKLYRGQLLRLNVKDTPTHRSAPPHRAQSPKL